METNRFFIHIVASNPHKTPLPIRLRQSQSRLDVTRIAAFPGWAKYSVAYGKASEPEFRYFELLTGGN
jgi:hypothetical protein